MHDPHQSPSTTATAPITQQPGRTSSARATSTMTPLARRVLVLRLGLDGRAPETQESIGERTGVTRARIQQVERWAMDVVRAESDHREPLATSPALARLLDEPLPRVLIDPSRKARRTRPARGVLEFFGSRALVDAIRQLDTLLRAAEGADERGFLDWYDWEARTFGRPIRRPCAGIVARAVFAGRFDGADPVAVWRDLLAELPVNDAMLAEAGLPRGAFVEEWLAFSAGDRTLPTVALEAALGWRRAVTSGESPTLIRRTRRRAAAALRRERAGRPKRRPLESTIDAARCARDYIRGSLDHASLMQARALNVDVEYAPVILADPARIHAKPSERSFADALPELVDWLDVERNGGSAAAIPYRSVAVLHWRCPAGHTFTRALKAMAQSPICWICRSIAVLHPTLAADWDQERNGDVGPDDVGVSDRAPRWWRCAVGHEAHESVHVRVWRVTHGKSACRACWPKRTVRTVHAPAPRVDEPQRTSPPTEVSRPAEGATPSVGVRPHRPRGPSIVDVVPELIEQWDTERNLPVRPVDVGPGSHYEAAWRCPAGHEFERPVSQRVIRPIGSGIRACPSCRSATPRRPRVPRGSIDALLPRDEFPMARRLLERADAIARAVSALREAGMDDLADAAEAGGVMTAAEDELLRIGRLIEQRGRHPGR